VKADEILRQAADVIEERGKLRDKPDGERSMARAVEAFNALTGATMSELEGWLFMSVLKIARATAGVPHLDDMTDLAGYAALAAECMDRPAPEPLPGIDCEATPYWRNFSKDLPNRNPLDHDFLCEIRCRVSENCTCGLNDAR